MYFLNPTQHHFHCTMTSPSDIEVLLSDLETYNALCRLSIRTAIYDVELFHQQTYLNNDKGRVARYAFHLKTICEAMLGISTSPCIRYCMRKREDTPMEWIGELFLFKYNNPPSKEHESEYNDWLWPIDASIVTKGYAYQKEAFPPRPYMFLSELPLKLQNIKSLTGGALVQDQGHYNHQLEWTCAMSAEETMLTWQQNGQMLHYMIKWLVKFWNEYEQQQACRLKTRDLMMCAMRVLLQAKYRHRFRDVQLYEETIHNCY